MNLEVNKIMVDELLKDSNRNEQNLGEVKQIQQMERQNFWLKGELNAAEINSSCDRKRIADLKAEIEQGVYKFKDFEILLENKENENQRLQSVNIEQLALLKQLYSSNIGVNPDQHVKDEQFNLTLMKTETENQSIPPKTNQKQQSSESSIPEIS